MMRSAMVSRVAKDILEKGDFDSLTKNDKFMRDFFSTVQRLADADIFVPKGSAEHAAALKHPESIHQIPGAPFPVLDSGKRQTFEGGMQRDSEEGKIKWHLVSSGPMLFRWACLLTNGAAKYDDDNWMKAEGEAEYKRFRASAFRHFMDWYKGKRNEDHGAAVFFNINGAEYVKDKMEEGVDAT